MTSPMYINSVPVFKQLLTALKAILAQADAHVVANSIEPDAFLQARLYPNMFPLVKQVQIATDFSRGISARLAGVAVPIYEGKEWAHLGVCKFEENLLLVRIGGLPMFVERTAYKRTLVLELQGKSGERLTANRDSLRYPHSTHLRDQIGRAHV